jgi:hypothetical protein
MLKKKIIITIITIIICQNGGTAYHKQTKSHCNEYTLHLQLVYTGKMYDNY